MVLHLLEKWNSYLKALQKWSLRPACPHRQGLPNNTKSTQFFQKYKRWKTSQNSSKTLQGKFWLWRSNIGPKSLRKTSGLNPAISKRIVSQDQVGFIPGRRIGSTFKKISVIPHTNKIENPQDYLNRCRKARVETPGLHSPLSESHARSGTLRQGSKASQARTSSRALSTWTPCL